MSVFTYDPNPPRVSSPWLQPADPGKSGNSSDSDRVSPSPAGLAKSGQLSDYGVTKLEAEPQEGPTEYKLHLLLRQRRKFRYMSTTDRIAGSQQSRPTPSEPRTPKQRVLAMASSSQTRQARLLQLTTQLFWRLRQSSPYHASVANQELVIPQLSDDSTAVASAVSIKPGKPLPGLEESRGALYEIGVADDGTLVGLTEEEMDESIATLRIMAASLGCNIDVLRRVIVGDCEWEQDIPTPAVHRGELWVAEVLVMPNLGSVDGDPSSAGARPTGTAAEPTPSMGPATTDQLRVTLTGPTTSGKSTLLGTLSTGTLDNGHGKSRLSLLRHRHELASGVTSSVAQELIGYNGDQIVNYFNRNIESWIGIHDFTEGGRLVFVSDSAGHPRYRRTILRGVVGWAPHWTLLCIAADDDDSGGLRAAPGSPTQDFLGVPAGVDLAKAHLELCLRLEIPLAIVVTKVDKATKPGLQRVLGKVLSSIKQAGRTPRMLQPDRRGGVELAEIPREDGDSVRKVVAEMTAEGVGVLPGVVPIVMTSAVRGTGIGLVHALLRYLPLPPPPTAHDLTGLALNPEQPNTLFHIEDKFSLPASHASIGGAAEDPADSGTVVAGYLRFGKLSVGDHVVVGPFPSAEDDDMRGLTPEGRQSPASYGLLMSHPSATELSRIASRSAIPASAIKGEWRNAQVVSIRNLRLPVLTLEAGQVGSIGLVITNQLQDAAAALSADHSPVESRRPPPKIRKGMVLAVPSRHMVDTGLSLQAASGLTASFRDPDASSLVVGGLVNIYVASVRAAARILRVSRVRGVASHSGTGREVATDDIDDVFDLDEIDGNQPHVESPVQGVIEVVLELLTNREWIELGSRIVILEGGRQDKSGLEGLVGTVVEIVD